MTIRQRLLVALFVAVMYANPTFSASQSQVLGEASSRPPKVLDPDGGAHTPQEVVVEPRVLGQTHYVPVYSHVYTGDRATPFNLTATVSIRNTDPHLPILIKAVDYFNTEGKMVRRFLPEPKMLAPMASLGFSIPESDTTGGSGANFLVQWRARKPVFPPLVESVMIGTRGQQGISFTSRGVALSTIQPISTRKPPEPERAPSSGEIDSRAPEP
jgi:hypothetical protein